MPRNIQICSCVSRIYAPFLLAGTAAVVSLSNFSAVAEDWPQWRGPHRNDIVDEHSGWTGLEWRLSEPIWVKKVGEGCTSPIVVGSHCYTMGWRGKDFVYCFDARNGQDIWEQSYACPQYGRHSVGDQAIYSGTTSTPTYDPETGLLFSLSVDGDLRCWNTQRDGILVWKLNLYDRYGAKRRPNVGKRNSQRDYGYTSSPLLIGDQLIVEAGGRDGNLASFNRRDGRQLWTSQCNDEAGHTGSPVPITVEGIECVAVLTLRNLVVTRIDSGHEGETLAQFPWITDFGNNIATPAVHNNTVLITSAYNQYSIARLSITKGGAKLLWKQDAASGVCSPIVHEGHAYWAWRGVHCLDLTSGREKWTGGKVGTAGSCIMTADDRLIVWSDQGDLQLLETAVRSPDAFRVLAERKRMFATDVWPHVVLANSHLYCKDRQGNIKCLRVESP